MNRNIGYFSRYASKDRTQEIIKGIEKMLEDKPEEKVHVKNLNEMPQDKYSQELKGIKGAIKENL